MKNQFRGYVRYTDDEFKTLWSTATFSFDANVLLDIYRVNTATASAFLEALKSLKERIWLTIKRAWSSFGITRKKSENQRAHTTPSNNTCPSLKPVSKGPFLATHTSHWNRLGTGLASSQMS